MIVIAAVLVYLMGLAMYGRMLLPVIGLFPKLIKVILCLPFVPVGLPAVILLFIWNTIMGQGGKCKKHQYAKRHLPYMAAFFWPVWFFASETWFEEERPRGAARILSIKTCGTSQPHTAYMKIPDAPHRGPEPINGIRAFNDSDSSYSLL